MAVIADKCPDINVVVVDINKNRINLWNDNDYSNLPIYEPGLDDVIRRCRNNNLWFSTDIKENIATSDMIFISVNTPTKTKGVGAGEASNLKWVESCAREVAKYANGHTIVVEKSTLPVRTAEVIKNILEASQAKKINSDKNSFDVLSNPEFLAEGSAIRDLEYPDRVLIGGDNPDAMNALGSIYENWVKEKILYTNLWSSELAKLTLFFGAAYKLNKFN